MATKLAGCIILNQAGEILLIHRNTSVLVQWELPGGKVEADETLEQAASREVHEEIGVEVDIVREVGSANFEDRGIDWEYHWFLATVSQGEPSIGEPEKFDGIGYFNLQTVDMDTVSINIHNLVAALKSGRATL